MTMGGAVRWDVAEGGQIRRKEDDLGPGREAPKGLVQAQNRQRTTKSAGINDQGRQGLSLLHRAVTVVCGR